MWRSVEALLQIRLWAGDFVRKFFARLDEVYILLQFQFAF